MSSFSSERDLFQELVVDLEPIESGCRHFKEASVSALTYFSVPLKISELKTMTFSGRQSEQANSPSAKYFLMMLFTATKVPN